MKRYLYFFAAIIAGSMLAFACQPEDQPSGDSNNENNQGTDNGDVVAVTSVTLDAETLSLEIGQMATLTATVLPENATDKVIAWSGENDAVVTVDDYGLVTAISEGTAKVTAKAGDCTAEVTVTVTPPVVVESIFSDVVENWEELSEKTYAVELPIKSGYSFADEFDFKDLFKKLPEGTTFALAPVSAQNVETAEYYESLTANLAADGIWTRNERFAHDLNVGDNPADNGVRVVMSAADTLMYTINFYIEDPVVGLETSDDGGHLRIKIDWIDQLAACYNAFGGLEMELGGSTNWQDMALKHGAGNDINLVALLNDVTNFQDQGPYFAANDSQILFSNWPYFSVSGTNGEELFFNDVKNGKIALTEYGANLCMHSKGFYFQQQWSVCYNCANWQLPEEDRPMPAAGSIAESTPVDGTTDFVGPEAAEIFKEKVGIYLTPDGHIKTTENYKGAGARISPQMHFEYDYGYVCVSQRYMFMLFLNRRWAAEGEVADVKYPFTDGLN